MKAIFYSTKINEKDLLIASNQQKHEITFTSKPLTDDTISCANGMDAVVVFTNDDLTASIIKALAGHGIKYIATRSVGMDHIDQKAAEKYNIKVANVPEYSPQAIAEHAVMLALALSRHLMQSNQQCRLFNFSLDHLTGFNLYGKTVGIIGLGHIGSAVAHIFHGLGCKVLGYDIHQKKINHVQPVSLDTLYKQSDIISLHVPLNPETRHIIDASSITKMKTGVMIINTARGELIKTTDALDALKIGKIGYLGLDVYEYEKGLFFEDHEVDQFRDFLFSELMKNPNVLITPHQAFLTKEALLEISTQIITTLDQWDHPIRE